MPPSLLYLSSHEVQCLWPEIDAVGVIREVFRLHATEQTLLSDEAYLGWINDVGESVRSLNMPSFVGGTFGMAGTKVINANPANIKRGLPRANGTTLLFDTTSANIICIMDGTFISAHRTAAVSALAVELFAAQNTECLAIIGAGVLAKAHLDLLPAHLPTLRRVRIFDICRQRVETLQSQVMSTLQQRDITVEIAATVEDAVRSAQVIVPVTTTTTGYIPYSWLQPATVLVNVSLDDPLPDVVLKADKVIVDDWHLVKTDPRRLLGRMFRAGQIVGPDDTLAPLSSCPPRHVDAQLGEVIIGTKPGRTGKDEIILVNPFGLAIEDVALATRVFQAATARGLGQRLER